ncbi:potassium channel family protein [Ekhidna sp.]|uniref:potassium channel family protein n=1 Tax=Ekhidna sp. TaxID=2608089 RepID=UPI003B500D92
MRFIAFVLFVVLSSFLLAQEEEYTYDEYSYTEFFQLIEDTEDSVFRLEKAIIKYDPSTDSLHGFNGNWDEFHSGRTDTIFVDKQLFLDDVHFEDLHTEDGKVNSVLHHISFSRKVHIKDAISFHFRYCTFKERLSISFRDRSQNRFDAIKAVSTSSRSFILIRDNRLQGGVMFDGVSNYQDKYPTQILFLNNLVYDYPKSWRFEGIVLINFTTANFIENKFIGNGIFPIRFDKLQILSFDKNEFSGLKVVLNINELDHNASLSVMDNEIDDHVFLNTKIPATSNTLDWTQFEGRLINDFPYNIAYGEHLLKKWGYDLDDYYKVQYADSSIQYFLDHYRIENAAAYREETKMRYELYAFYKAQGNIDFANSLYAEIKDLQTERLAYLYRENPTFDSYFTWKINQFLKVFSAYGTRPAKAVIFALYVIAFFALIYLFFPNSWDAHGRTRIMDRYRFFLKYLNRNEGASEVYQEEKENELMPFHEFRDYLEQQGKTAPKFFYATALPLYKWSVSGSRLSGWFLSKIDVLNGKWSDVPEKGRFFKSVLVIGAFIIALLYDLFIKVLNAIMLSINTFTTLGFGEIPIKGLPRYLAIVQGFIGWFMLTIFSVSLISQLLN